MFDNTVIQSSRSTHFTPSEALQLQTLASTKDWAHRESYADKIQALCDQLLEHKQQTINVTKAGHEYENFIMDQAKRKHQIVQMTDLQGCLCKGNRATEATAQQWAAKFQSVSPGPLGFQGSERLPLSVEEHDNFLQAVTDTAMPHDYRSKKELTLADPISEYDIIVAM